MGELAERAERLLEYVDEIASNELVARIAALEDDLALARVSAEETESRIMSLAAINRDVETHSDQLTTALYDACDGWKDLWDSDNNIPPPARIAELEAVADGYREKPADREGVTWARNHSLSQRLAAAEARAERAERMMATIVGDVKRRGRAVGASSYIVSAIAERQSANFTIGELECRLTIEPPVVDQHELIVLAYESARASADNLERRALELIEAGEKLLEEYKKQTAAADAASAEVLR